MLAGCSSSGGATDPGTTAPAEPPAPESTSARTAPAKSLDVPDACSVVTAEQANALGADQAPRPNDLHGTAGCNYQAGEAGTNGGWSAFVAADKSQTLQDFSAGMTDVQNVEVAGYPAGQIGTNPTNCILVLDVSDEGSLLIETLSRTGTPNPCDISKQVAEAAVQNLPSA
ncbi:DUF3558 domain-containing protein [Saccharopolyspora rhizosphaerae]|uniref:DUF3558 domain-containing protein n=1 Tax=Saccharopolyspora rhizosphaerae TaxID=2492662 RepID=UPI001F2EFA80|nr:DUF3558 domain-containing protein [Saccharopolyspora rhizosphaerae]